MGPRRTERDVIDETGHSLPLRSRLGALSWRSLLAAGSRDHVALQKIERLRATPSPPPGVFATCFDGWPSTSSREPLSRFNRSLLGCRREARRSRSNRLRHDPRQPYGTFPPRLGPFIRVAPCACLVWTAAWRLKSATQRSAKSSSCPWLLSAAALEGLLVLRRAADQQLERARGAVGHILLPAYRSKRALQHASDTNGLRPDMESRRLLI